MNDDLENAADSEVRDIQRFLTREAILLDQRRYSEWLALLDETIRYRVTACVIRDASVGHQQYAIIDEDMTGLRSRVDQVANQRLTRAESPPTVTRRFLSNIDAKRSGDGGFLVASNILVYRNKAGYLDGGFYVGCREDELRRSERHGFQIVRRQVDLDHQIILEGTVSVLF